jgi:hypothetical protein
MGPIDAMDRARAQIAGSHPITSAVAVATGPHKGAVANAISPGSPFERRFRDIDTLLQQIQSRDAHCETVGQVLLGNSSEVFTRDLPFPIALQRLVLASLSLPCPADLNPCSGVLIPCSPT